MQLFSTDATMFKKKKIAHENVKNPPSKVAQKQRNIFFSIANRLKTSPNLNFCPIKIAHLATYV